MLGTIVDAEVKRETVLETCTLLGCEPSRAIVVGDGSNDLKMMEISGASVAFHAKPVVQEKTDFCIIRAKIALLMVNMVPSFAVQANKAYTCKLFLKLVRYNKARKRR